MIKAIELLHPQSADLLSKRSFNTKAVEDIRISCGTTKIKTAHFSEAGDFFPTYASWNSSLFETSVILTVWEHADELIGNDNVAILHSDIELHFKPAETWKKIEKSLTENPGCALSLSVPVAYRGLWEEWLIPDDAGLTPANDPYKIHAFENGIHIWDMIKQYDHDIHDWAFDTQPKMIYSHQFACTRKIFDQLGQKLWNVAHRLRLDDMGFWTPHVFERLISLYLAYYGEPVLTTAFWHHQSSGIYGPGDHSLYGPRPFRYYKVCTRANSGLRRETTPPDAHTNLPTDPLEKLFRC
jgi:hypothetical protein